MVAGTQAKQPLKLTTRQGFGMTVGMLREFLAHFPDSTLVVSMDDDIRQAFSLEAELCEYMDESGKFWSQQEYDAESPEGRTYVGYRKISRPLIRIRASLDDPVRSKIL